MGRGGLRWGAGRPGWHVKAEHCLRLDVRALARRKLLGHGWFDWFWKDGHTGERIGTISISSRPESLALSYTVSGDPVIDNVPIERTACTLGGTRPWFRCPRCQRRVAVLHLRGSRFVCRACGGVAYASQSEDDMGRAWRRQRKLEARLGDDWRRPQGMHWATHARLLSALIACEDRRECALAALIGRYAWAIE